MIWMILWLLSGVLGVYLTYQVNKNIVSNKWVWYPLLWRTVFFVVLFSSFGLISLSFGIIGVIVWFLENSTFLDTPVFGGKE